jgi:hypothetical protein
MVAIFMHHKDIKKYLEVKEQRFHNKEGIGHITRHKTMLPSISCTSSHFCCYRIICLRTLIAFSCLVPTACFSSSHLPAFRIVLQARQRALYGLCGCGLSQSLNSATSSYSKQNALRLRCCPISPKCTVFFNAETVEITFALMSHSEFSLPNM